jgi:hypothetical protein
MYVTDQKYYTETMLTEADRVVNIKIAMIDGIPYKDVSMPLDGALYEISKEAESVASGVNITNSLNTAFIGTGEAYRRAWFISKVTHKADWDIKRESSWNKIVGESTYPGFGTKVYYFGDLVTPEELGNYTYGYIGAALGISLEELYAGSWIAAGVPVSGDAIKNEFTDWESIKSGYNRYKGK